MAPSLLNSIVFYLTLAYAYSNGSAEDKPESESSTPSSANMVSADIEEAIKFMIETDEEKRRLYHDWTDAFFQYSINLTDVNMAKSVEKGKIYDVFYSKAYEKSKDFSWTSFKGVNSTLYRWYKSFLLSPDLNFLSPHKQSQNAIYQIFKEAKVFPYKSSNDLQYRNHNQKMLVLNPDLVNIFARSIDTFELRYYWYEFRDVTGMKIRNLFINQVEIENEKARERGFKNQGEIWVSEYESSSFVEDMASLMSKIQPLYEQIHAYVRGKLIHFYKKAHIKEDGPIPAHFLGNMHAQSWSNIFDIVNPIPMRRFLNTTKLLHRKNLTPLDMFVMAEEFYTSIGLEHMTPYFWRKSVIEKPEDRDIVCNSAAYNLLNGKDYRIRMCAEVTEEDLHAVYRKMAHVENFMLLNKSPTVFQDSANPGLYEAVGIAMTLSVSTLSYLKDSDLVDTRLGRNKETDMAHLLQAALGYIPAIPYAYIIDLYRYGVYNGSIKSEELNKKWWEYRLQYQGVCPPVKRTEEDWDLGAHMQDADLFQYMRYSVANILAFQIHRSLCIAAGNTGPLYKCSIYKSKEAGQLLRKILSLGRSVPWQEVVKILTGGETSSLDAQAILEYFEPLMEWLQEENKRHTVGWKSESIMLCPMRAHKKKLAKK